MYKIRGNAMVNVEFFSGALSSLNSCFLSSCCSHVEEKENVHACMKVGVVFFRLKKHFLDSSHHSFFSISFSHLLHFTVSVTHDATLHKNSYLLVHHKKGTIH